MPGLLQNAWEFVYEWLYENAEQVVGQQGMVGAVGRAITQGVEWVYPLLRADDRSATVTLTGTDENTTSSATTVNSILTSASWADVDSGALLATASLASTGEFSLVLIGPMLWTRFEHAGAALRMDAHTSGPASEDVVIVTDELRVTL